MRQRRFLPLLILMAASCAPLSRWGRPRAASAPLPPDSQVVRGELPNGLTYYIRVNDEPRSRAELRLAVDAGSILEDEDQRGLAHVVEHMAFNGTEHFRKNQLVDYLESVGMRFGPDINAYTSYDETVYMLTLPTDSAGVLDTGFQILEDWAHGLTFDSVEVEKERGVVMEEWRLGQGAGTRLRQQQFPVLTHGSRYADREPIGTPESLDTFKQSALRRFYHDWYRPDLMAIVAVGDFDPHEVERQIREHFGDIPLPEHPRERPEYGIPPSDHTMISVATDPEATSTTVSVYLKRPPTPWLTFGAYRDWIVRSLASGMLVDRLSERTHRPGSPFLGVSSYQGRFLRPLSAYVLSIRVPDGGVERGLGELLAETERVDQHGFTATELARQKQEVLRGIEQRYAERDKTTSASYAADYVSQFLYGGVVVSAETEYRLYQEIVPDVTLAEVDDVVRGWMRDRDRVILVKAPSSDSSSIPTERRLRQVVADAENRPVVAYTDSVSDAPLIAVPPTPGRIVAERQLAVGVTEWQLDNGVRVLLKPTDFREEHVLLAASSPGGTSLYPDSDYVAALTASAVVQAGGLGDLTVTELRKRLTGKSAAIGAAFTARTETLSGGASSRDLETLFQLAYLRFTAPRLDSAAIEAYRIQAKSAIVDRAASPENVFLDTLRVTLSQHHPRARPPTGEMFDNLDIQRSFQIYRDRFADAGDFTFYVVGSFTLDSIKPLVLRYLGGLPSHGRIEHPRDLGVTPPKGIVRRTVYEGVEPKALTQLIFTGDFDFGRDQLNSLTVLADALTLRLRQSLRENLSGTYGVNVQAIGWKEPRPTYQISIGFGSAPDRVDELTRVVFAEIDSLRTIGPTADEIEKVRETELRERQTDLRRNTFWISKMLEFDEQGWDLGDILAYSRWLRGIDEDLVRSTAARYLDTGNYIQASLLPESAAITAGKTGSGDAPPPRSG